MTHNFEIITRQGEEALLIGAKEGAKVIERRDGKWLATKADDWAINDFGFGEIRKSQDLIAGIQPMHGNFLALYTPKGERKVLTDSLAQGHALAFADFLSQGHDQIVVGWRNKKRAGRTRCQAIYRRRPQHGKPGILFWIDKNDMACEDLKVADLNGDGKPDVIAAGRSTRNLKIYWNRFSLKSPPGELVTKINLKKKIFKSI